jgi:hypothetical protein
MIDRMLAAKRSAPARALTAASRTRGLPSLALCAFLAARATRRNKASKPQRCFCASSWPKAAGHQPVTRARTRGKGCAMSLQTDGYLSPDCGIVTTSTWSNRPISRSAATAGRNSPSVLSMPPPNSNMAAASCSSAGPASTRATRSPALDQPNSKMTAPSKSRCRSMPGTRLSSPADASDFFNSLLT